MTQFISACLEQIKWKRYRDGAYSSLDPYLPIRDKLRRMRDGSDEALNDTEIRMLLKATQESIRYIQRRPHLPETLAEATQLRDYLWEITLTEQEAEK